MKRGLGAWVHGCVGWPIYLWWTAVAGLCIAVSRLLGRGDLGIRALGWTWGHAMWWTIPFWQRRIDGLERVGPGPYVVVANHQSVIDIPCLYGLPLRLKVAARPGIFSAPVLGPFVRWSGQVDTDAFFEQGQAALAEGYSVLVFPEGSRSADGEVKRFRRGAFELAQRAGVPVLAVAMDGAQVILSKRNRMPLGFLAPVRVRVLGPVEGPDAAVLAKQTRLAVATELARMRAA